ncbi:MAG: hypothetical protein IKQ35_03925 [Bacilli bacterium]|nr:hypothetical protein [Bacilli bacterium]
MENRGYYYHAIRNTKDKSLKILDGILTNGIKSVASGEIECNESYRMNNDDEICLCRDTNTSTINRIKNLYIGNIVLPDFINSGMIILRINPDISGVFKPEVLLPHRAYSLIERGFRGYTEYNDEYRTKESISPTDINGILFPARVLLSSTRMYSYALKGYYSMDNQVSKKDAFLGVINYYEAVVDTVKKSGLSIKIYDSRSMQEIESVRDIEKIKRK